MRQDSRPDRRLDRAIRIIGGLAVVTLLALTFFAAGSTTTAHADALFRVSGDVHVGPDQVVDSASTLNGDIVVEGHVLESVFAANGDIEVRPGGRVDGEAVSLTGHVLVDEGGVVGGDIVELGGTQITSGGGDSTVAEPPPARPIQVVDGGSAFSWFFFLLGSLGLGLLLVLIAGASLRGVGQEMMERPGRSALISLGASLGLPVLWVVLLISVVGIPVALLMIPAVPLVAMFGIFAIALLAGDRLLGLVGREDAGPAWSMIAGVTLLAIISLVPILGVLVLMTAAFLGLGATFARVWDIYQTRRMIKSAAYQGGGQPTVTPPIPGPYAPQAPPASPTPSTPTASDPQGMSEAQGASPTPVPYAPEAPPASAPPALPSAPVAEAPTAPEKPSPPVDGPKFHI